MSRSGNYSMLTQVQERLKAEGKDPTNISLLSRETGLSRDTIRKYLAEGVRPHKGKGKRKASKLDAFKGFLKQQFSGNQFNCESLYDRLVERGYDGGITIVREYVRQFRPEPEAASVPARTMRFETDFGKQMQMDWGFVSYRTGTRKQRRKKLACLVVVCGASRKRYVEFFSSSRQECLFIGMIHAFLYFEGIAETMLTDNMKSVVQSRNKLSIVFNAKYEAFMAELGFGTRLCKVRTPQTKGKSERLVDYVKDNFFPGRTFSNLIDLNVQALAWCDRVNDKEHGTTGLVPSEVHEQEKRHLKALPSQDILDRYLWVERKVSFDGMVSYEGCKFGIIHTCNDQYVNVTRIGAGVLIMGSQGELVGDYTITGKQKMYYHPYQWPEQYRRDNGRGKRNYGFAIQDDEFSTFSSSDSSNLADYDHVAGGGF